MVCLRSEVNERKRRARQQQEREPQRQQTLVDTGIANQLPSSAIAEDRKNNQPK